MALVHTRKIVGDLLKEGSQVYDVPFYQRDYVWDAENIKNLIDDLLHFSHEKKTKNDPNAKYYMGSFVIKETTKDYKTKTVLVDGQQRFTSFLILFAALSACCPKQEKELAANIKDAIDKFAFIPKEGEPKLKLNRYDDDRELIAILKGRKNKRKPKEKNANRVHTNFNAAVSRLKELIRDEDKSISDDETSIIERIFKSIYECVYAHVEVQPTDDENTIFESINSRGVKLKQADLIKNYLYVRSGKFRDGSESRDFKERFEALQANVGEHIDDFFRSVVMIESNCGPFRTPRSYAMFKAYVDTFRMPGEDFPSEQSVENFFRKIEFLGEIYNIKQRINDARKGDPHLLFMTILLPQFKTLFNLFARLIIEYKGMEDEKTYREIVRIIARIVLYRSFSPNNQTRDLSSLVDNVFAAFLDENLSRHSLSDFEKWLERKGGKFSYPDVEFMVLEAKKYMTGDKPNINVKNILFAYEHSINGRFAIDIRDVDRQITIEHFYPQTPETWNKEVEATEEYIDQMSYRTQLLGNLFLLNHSENASLGNLGPKEKIRKMFADHTYYKMLEVLRNRSDWNPADVDERTEEIVRSVFEYAKTVTAKNAMQKLA